MRALSASAGSQLLDSLSFKGMGLLGWFCVSLGVNWVGWAVSAPLRCVRLHVLCANAYVARHPMLCLLPRFLFHVSDLIILATPHAARVGTWLPSLCLCSL